MGVVSHVVGQRGRLGFGARKGRQVKPMPRVVFADRDRNKAAGQRAVVFHQAFQRFPAEVQAIETRVTALQPGHDPKRLGIVVEPAPRCHHGSKHVFARMAERRMTEVMGKRYGFGEIVVEPEGPRQRTGNLGHLDRVGQPRSKMVAFGRHKDLCLVGEPAERRRMHDAIAVALEDGPGWRRRLGNQAATRLRRVDGIGRPNGRERQHGGSSAALAALHLETLPHGRKLRFVAHGCAAPIFGTGRDDSRDPPCKTPFRS